MGMWCASHGKAMGSNNPSLFPAKSQVAAGGWRQVWKHGASAAAQRRCGRNP